MKIDKMADVFLNSANFVQHSLLILATPSGYTLYPKAEHLNFHTKYCDFHLKETLEKTNELHFSEKIPPNSLGSLGLSTFDLIKIFDLSKITLQNERMG